LKVYTVLYYLIATHRVQEIMNDDRRETGRIPRTVDCELTDDLGMSLLSATYNV